MTNYIRGKVKQASKAQPNLEWQDPTPCREDDIRCSSITELDVELDTSRFHIGVPVDGTEPYEVDGKNFAVAPGEYFILNPQQEARAAGRFPQDVTGLCLFLTKETVAETAQALSVPLENSLSCPFDFPWQQHEFLVKTYRLQENSFGQYLSRLCNTLLNWPDNRLMDWDTFYIDLASEFLAAHRQIGQHLSAIPSAKAWTKKELYRRLCLAHVFILENHAQPISLEDVQQAAMLSKYHLVRLYRRVYGLTPYQHILRERVKLAKKLLRKNHSPTEIAAQLSFSDRRAFAKTFKRMEGMSPSAFQRNSQQI